MQSVIVLDADKDENFSEPPPMKAKLAQPSVGIRTTRLAELRSIKHVTSAQDYIGYELVVLPSEKMSKISQTIPRRFRRLACNPVESRVQGLKLLFTQLQYVSHLFLACEHMNLIRETIWLRASYKILKELGVLRGRTEGGAWKSADSEDYNAWCNGLFM